MKTDIHLDMDNEYTSHTQVSDNNSVNLILLVQARFKKRRDISGEAVNMGT